MASSANTFDFNGAVFKASGFASSSFSPSNLLDSRYEDFAKGTGLVPSSSKMFIPSDPKVKVNWVCPGWFSIYEIAFRAGFSVPCSILVAEVIRTLGVQPFQLMPTVWKILSAIDALCDKHQLEIRVSDLKNVYHVRTSGKGRVCFRSVKFVEPLITNIDSSENWNNKFMFLEKESLGDGYSFIPETLIEDIVDWERDPQDEESMARIEAFRSLGAEERAWPQALGKPYAPSFVFSRTQPKSSVSVDVGGVDSAVPSCLALDNRVAEICSVQPLKMEFPAPCVASAHVSARTRGKGKKVYSVLEEVAAFRKKAKIETVSSASDPIEVSASPDAKCVSDPVTSPCQEKMDYNEGSSKKKRADKISSFSLSEAEFLDAPFGRSDAITRFLSSYVAPGSSDLGACLLAKKNIYSAFQALHFSCASFRAAQSDFLKMKTTEEELSTQKSVLLRTENALCAEKESHADTLLRLQAMESKLQSSQQEVKEMKEQVIATQEGFKKREQEIGVQYMMVSRINMLLESPEERAKWDLKEEVNAFKLRFPDQNPQDWGIPDLD